MLGAVVSTTLIVIVKVDSLLKESTTAKITS
jgi:hypothetical protein